MEQTTEAPGKDRRDILKGALAVAAGAAAAVIATAGSADGADGQTLELGFGAINESSTKTLWTNDGTNWMLDARARRQPRITLDRERHRPRVHGPG